MADSTVLTSTLRYAGPAFSVVSEQVQFPNALTATRDVVRHPGAVVILPLLNESTILFVRQYRHPIGRSILELPAGTLEVGEEPLVCAQREICEEVGYAARQWTGLGELFPAPGFCDEKQHLFLATDLFEKVLPGDEDEIIEVEAHTLESIMTMIREQDLVDAKSLSALFRASALGHIRL